jgi:hypothetical protein
MHFPEQGLIILISRTYSQANLSVMTFQSHVVIRSTKAPLLYQGLLELTAEPPATPISPMIVPKK